MKPLCVLPLLFAFLFAACAPTTKVAGPLVSTPQLAERSIIATDAEHLPLRSWLPTGEVLAVVVAVHGFNDYSNAFDEPGRVLADAGIATYAFDLRGFGAAPNRGYWAGENAMVDDLSTVARLVAARHPGKPLYLLGESMGGALVMLAATRPGAPKIQGVILSAPAVWNRASMSVLERVALWFTSYTVPWLTVSGSGLGILPSDNIEMLRRLGRDPLVIKETRVDAIHGLCELMDDASASASALHLPALVLYGEHDEIIPAAPTYRMMAQLPNIPAPPVKAIYTNGYHMLLRDLQAEVVLADIVAWIKHPEHPLPSGADRRANVLLDGGGTPSNGTTAAQVGVVSTRSSL